MSITYRDGRAGDGEALHRLFETSFSDTFSHLYEADDLNAFLTSFGVDDWEKQLADRKFACRIAEVERRPAGYIKLGPLKLPIEAHGPALLLDQLYVLKEHHGIGLAHALMGWGLEEAVRRGAQQIFLTVYVDNHRARRFYDRYGFEAVGCYDFMVGNHADEDIIMVKRL